MVLVMLVTSVSAPFFTSTSIAILVTTIFLHRSLTHEAFKLKKPTQWVCRIACWIWTGTIPKYWVAVHRKHHAYTDVAGDPHSPALEGFWNIQLFNTWYYIKECKTIDLKVFAQRVPDYGWFDRHDILGLITGLLISCALFGILGASLGLGFLVCSLFGIIAAFVHTLAYLILNSTINGLCHVWGYKNYSHADAYNIRTLAPFTGGETLHNNHHYNQRSPKLSTGNRWFEVDFGWSVIKFLDQIGQVESKSESWPAN